VYRPFVESSVVSFEAVAPDRVEMGRRMAEGLTRYPWLVCEIDGVVAGYAYGATHAARAAYRWSADTSVYIDRRYWRRGVGRGLYRSLFALLTAQGVVNAYAGVTPTVTPSPTIS
jgi:phosphinothricin acetyltransferase